MNLVEDPTLTARQFRPVGDFYNPIYTITFLAPHIQALTAPDSEISPPLSAPGFTGFVSNFGLDTGVSINNGIAAAEQQIVNDKQTLNNQLTLNKAVLDNYATNISIDCAGEGPLKCRVTLSPPRDVGIAILSSGMIQRNSYMVIEWGYPGLMSKSHNFVLIQPQAEFTERDSTITLVGVDVFSTNLMRKTSLNQYDRSNISNRSDFLIIQDLLNTYNLTLAPESTLYSVTNIYSPTQLPLTFTGDDWELFKYICTMHRIMYTIEGDSVIRLTPWTTVVKQDSKYTLGFSQQPGSNTEFPIKSMRINTISSAFFEPSQVNIRSNQIDIDSGLVTNDDKDINDANFYSQGNSISDGTVAGSVKAPEITFKNETTVNPVPGLNPIEGDCGRSLSHPSREGNVAGKVNSLLIGTSLAVNMRASITTLGHPDLLPPTCVTIDGMGELGGSYFILKAQHNLGTDGYEVVLELLRTSTPKVLGGTKLSLRQLPETPTSANAQFPTTSANQTALKNASPI